MGANVFFLSISRHWFQSMSGKQQNRDVPHVQRLEISNRETLVVTNVDEFPENGHWPRSTSQKSQKKDVGRIQRQENHGGKTLAAINVRKITKNNLDGSDVRKTERGKTLIAANA
jgi:hypothetical protein